MSAVPSTVSDPARPVHIVFVGAGAVGCFYASRLHHPEHNLLVSLIARSNYKAIAQHGVKLQTRSFGDYVFTPQDVFQSVAAATSAPNASAQRILQAWDYVVVTTKALPDRGDDSALIAPLVGPGTCIVLIQNGVGVEDPYRSRFPGTPIVSGVTVVSAEQLEPGVVRQNRWTRIHLGPYSNSAAMSEGTPPSPPPTRPQEQQQQGEKDENDYSHRLAAWLSRLGHVRDAEAHTEAALQAIRWHKLCINAAMNPSSVLSGGLGPAAMLADPELRAHLRGVMDELWAAAPRVLGGPFPPPGLEELATPDRIIASAARNVGARPSMLLDWEAGRPLELEVILGNAVRLARRRGVDLPRCQALYALLRSAMAVREEGERTKQRQEKL